MSGGKVCPWLLCFTAAEERPVLLASCFIGSFMLQTALQKRFGIGLIQAVYISLSVNVLLGNLLSAEDCA